MIKIICLGKLKEKYLQEALEEYKKRLTKYTNLEIIELQDESYEEEQLVLKKEKEKIEKYLNPKDYIIVLDVNGEEYTSLEFSSKIDKILSINSNITFIIGGSYGLDKEIKDKSNLRLSFSKMTFPHQLFRIILLEQIYRSYKILNNERYHK